MSQPNNDNFIQPFTMVTLDKIFEDSNLSQIGLPKAMIKKIHTKEEHYSSQYPQMGHTYKSRAAIPMPYQYFIPSADIEIPEPIKLRGRKSNRSPFQDKEVKSEYTDFAWYLQSIPFGAIRIFVVNPDIDFFMFLYHKQASKGATGEQYAVMAWDPETRRVIDYGYSELTTSGVDRSQIRGVHDTKGGNTNGKIQEFVRALTRQGGKKYSPSLEKPLWIYNIKVEPATEPRVTRETRTSGKLKSNTLDFLRVLADRFSKIIPKLGEEKKEAFQIKIKQEYTYAPKNYGNVPEFKLLGDAIGMKEEQTFNWLNSLLVKFRKELFEEGRARSAGSKSAYDTTSGYELEQDNYLFAGLYGNSYIISKQSYSPDEEGPNPETGFREAQAEKYKRRLPLAGEYASIPSMIAKHSLDGIVDKFIAFAVTGKIKTPKLSIEGAFGIKDKNLNQDFKRKSATVTKKEDGSWLDD